MASSILALSLAGCGASVEIGDIRIRLPGPDRGSPGGAPDRSPSDAAAAREAALDALVEQLTDGRGRLEDVVLRLSLTGGWGLAERGDLHLSIEGDGRVVRVTDTSVFSSTEDYTSLQLSQDGIVRVLEAVRPLLSVDRDLLDGGSGVSPTDRYAWLEVGPGITLSMDRIGQTDGYGPEQRRQRAAFAMLLDRLEDLAWLGDDIVAPETPWVPETMTVLASWRGPGDPGATSSFAPWPLERSVEELASGTEVAPSGQERLVVCLAGDDVAPVFRLLTGVNHAHLGVDDGRRWELDVRPQFPGYRLAGDPCLDALAPL